jgi:hypothetical protein
MHKSRLGALIIDCKSDDLDRDAQFWGKALGCAVYNFDDEPAGERYRGLKTDPSQPQVLVQRVDHPSRVHLDIETDDAEAEVARLERLGAKLVDRVRSFSIMEAPSGHRFCVVTSQRADFAEKANVWND